MSEVDFYIEENYKGSEVVHSDSGKYTLEIRHYSTKKGCWDFTMGVVSSGGRVICSVKRNYSSFWHLFVEGHPNGHDYMLCGSDYQGQTIVELTTGVVKHYLPPEAEEGNGLCWVSAYISPKKTRLAAVACTWGGPYDVYFYDFTDPMTLPWPVLMVSVDGNGFVRWIGEDAAVLEWSDGDAFCVPLSKYLSDMSIEETEEVDKLARSLGLDESDFYDEINDKVYVEIKK